MFFAVRLLKNHKLTNSFSDNYLFENTQVNFTSEFINIFKTKHNTKI